MLNLTPEQEAILEKAEKQPVACEVCNGDGPTDSGACGGCGFAYNTPPTQPLAEGADAEKLRVAVEALKPFARAADGLDGLWSEDDWRWNDSVRSNVTVRDLRRARDVLATLQQENKPK